MTADYHVIMRYFPQSYTFLYGVKNVSDTTLEITMDWCPESTRGLLHSPQLEEGAQEISKIVKAGQLQFMFYSEAHPDAEEVARKVQVKKCVSV